MTSQQDEAAQAAGPGDPSRRMQWCHAAGGGCVWISARLDEIDNDIPLACRVPACRAGDADHRRVQRLSTPPVSGPDVGPRVIRSRAISGS